MLLPCPTLAVGFFAERWNERAGADSKGLPDSLPVTFDSFPIPRRPSRLAVNLLAAAESSISMHSSLDREAFQQLLANAFAVQESQINSRSLSAIMEVHRLVTRGELDVDGAMHHLVEAARNVADATGAAIGLLKGDKLTYRAGSGSAASCIGSQVTASLTVSADNKTKREILRVENALADSRIDAAICRQFGVQSLLILPIYHAGALAGVLEVLFSEAHTFEDCEVRTYRLMTRQIEAAMLQAEQEKHRPEELPTIPHAIQPIASQAETLLNHSESLAGLLTRHSINEPRGAVLAAAMKLPTLKRPAIATQGIRRAQEVRWPGRKRTLALAAVAMALGIAGWLAYNSLLPGSPMDSSARPTSTVTGQQARPNAPEGLLGKTTTAIQPAPVPAKEARPGLRRVRVGTNEVDYIGEDVTVRLFTYQPPPQRRPAGNSRVQYIGDDVTVRYFPPSPAAKSGTR